MEIVPELRGFSSDKGSVELHAESQREYKMIGQYRRVPGHTLFEYDQLTCEIRPACVSTKVVLGNDGQPAYKSEVVWKDGCVYIQALNARNALRKLGKILD